MLDTTWDAIRSLLGLDAQELNSGQMAIRAVLTFVFTLAVLRFGSKRLFGKGTAFNYIAAIMIGSVMSRSITGSSPFFPTWAAGTVLVGLHWLLAYLTSRLDWFGPLVKGNTVELIRDGEVLADGMREGNVSRHDLEQALRDQGLEPEPAGVKRAVLERDGSINAIPMQGEPQILEVSVEKGVQTVRIAVK